MFLFKFSRLPLKYRSFKFSTQQEENFKLVYSFPYSRVGSLVNKFKLKQALISSVAVPACFALEAQTVVPSGSAIACIVICSSLTVSTFAIGQFFYKIIGKAYLSESESKAKLSYIGFFGRREEVVVNVNQICLSDSSSSLFYTKIRIEDSKLSLKVNEKYNDYCDISLSRKLFGESFMR